MRGTGQDPAKRFRTAGDFARLAGRGKPAAQPLAAVGRGRCYSRSWWRSAFGKCIGKRRPPRPPR